VAKPAGRLGPTTPRKDKTEPEEAEAVHSSDDALRFNPFHRLKLRQNIHAETKQARDITLKRDVFGREFLATFGLLYT
jgi:hypothetical protein